MSDDRCCCGVCHVKTGTWIIGILQFISCVGSLIRGIVFLGAVKEGSKEADDGTRYGGIGQVVLNAIWLLMIILLFVGLYKNRPGFILPHLIVTAVYVILNIGSNIWMIISGVEIGQAIGMIIVVLIIFGLLWVEWRCYKYISAIA